ncbi:MAG: alkaline phosphatase family protein, partial [Lachnospiraceae bacterium]|nr:alkaline phosphatase family protein [Lachnospiraceae bacterium]
GGKETSCKNEERELVPSPKEVPTYDLKPEMSAYKVVENVVDGIGKYDLVVVNFANPDMVGHTGNLEAAIKAIEAVDTCVGKVFDKIIENKGNLFIIADHGNAETMKDENGNPYTAHTSNPVPFCLVNPLKYKIKEGGRLCDVAPTILKLMGIEQPKLMTGVPLIYL